MPFAFYLEPNESNGRARGAAQCAFRFRHRAVPPAVTLDPRVLCRHARHSTETRMCGARGSAHLVTWWTRTARQPSRADTAPHRGPESRFSFAIACSLPFHPRLRHSSQGDTFARISLPCMVTRLAVCLFLARLHARCANRSETFYASERTSSSGLEGLGRPIRLSVPYTARHPHSLTQKSVRIYDRARVVAAVVASISRWCGGGGSSPVGGRRYCASSARRKGMCSWSFVGARPTIGSRGPMSPSGRRAR